MAFLKSPVDINKITFGRRHLWDIKFSDPNYPIPAPFNNWFPAFQTSIQLAQSSVTPIQTIFGTFSLPGKMNLDKPMSISFYDDEIGTLEKYFRKWIYSINGIDFNSIKFNGILHLDLAARKVEVRKLSSNRKNINTPDNMDAYYWIIPEGDITFIGESDAGLKQYDLPFKIVGSI